MARQHKEEYDWLNDPFDEKKAQAERESARFSTASKVTLGCGCVGIVLIIAVVLLVFSIQFFSLLSA